MTTVSVIDPANAQSIDKKYTKGDLLKKLYYQSSQTDTQCIDGLIYPRISSRRFISDSI